MLTPSLFKVYNREGNNYVVYRTAMKFKGNIKKKNLSRLENECDLDLGEWLSHSFTLEKKMNFLQLTPPPPPPFFPKKRPTKQTKNQHFQGGLSGY